MATSERELLAWEGPSRMPQLLFRRDMPKEAFPADDPLELPGCLPYVPMRSTTALQGLGYLEGEQHTPKNVLISQLRNWQGELPCHAVMQSCSSMYTQSLQTQSCCVLVACWSPYCMHMLSSDTNSKLLSLEASVHGLCTISM